MSDGARITIIWLVTTAWGINFTAPLVTDSYHPSEAINGVFLIVVGYLFASRGTEGISMPKRKKRKKDD